MTQTEFWDGIGLPEAARRAALEASPSQRETSEWKNLFLSEEEAFYRKLRSQEEPDVLVLSLYSNWALDTQREYERLGIPETVFFDSFRDLTLWSAQYQRQKGRWGLTEWEWNALTLKLAIFRLGRLQFQPRKLAYPVSACGTDIPKGTSVLEIHIPEGTPLAPEQIEASLRAAPPFFARYFSECYSLFHCHSWLLAPELTELLNPGSNILAFRALFDVYDVDYSFRQAEERVFGEIRDDLNAYPESTRLQKRLKAFLKAGGRIGMGLGVIRAM